MTAPTLPMLRRAAVLVDGNGEPVDVPIEGDDGRGVNRPVDTFGLMLLSSRGEPVDIRALLGAAKARPDAVVENLAGRAEFDARPRFFSVLVTDDEQLYWKLSDANADWSGPVPWSEADLIDGYTHTQASPASTWTINHNLGRRPLVSLFTTGGVEFEADVVHTSPNQCIASLAGAHAGTARCL